ncbi:transporter substrate-binding domain-containing protein [Pectobacterium sp. A5351]|uniref:transporter substrate-binding domain-containing protein n=1 Tax=Pectobacterium sp. A5351 TaxID=2914983 RepID=UPI00232FA63C|nr:transporter substrate-binding domain-containing protein [Pectobacterium sp. A5351]WCG82425.1 transporter substrate-binding domain-containing protein [Pectobacterium sp. A5351]
MFRKLSILKFVVIFAISPFAFAKSDILRIGVDLTFSPFQSMDKNGNPSGFDIEITDAICKSINAKCDYIVNTFDSQISALLAKKIDVIAPLGVTRTRRESIDFSNYVFHVPTKLVARKESNLLPNVDLLRGKKIAVQKGTIQEAYANKYWLPAGVMVKSYRDQEAIYESLHSGKVEGALSPSVAIEFGFLQTPQGKDFELKGPEVTDADLFSLGSAYGIRKDDTKTKQLINQGLKDIVQKGLYAKIKKRYFGDIDLSVKE